MGKFTPFFQIEGEIWKPVSDFNGLFEVSSLGRVKTMPRKVSNNATSKEGLMTDHSAKGGYRRVSLRGMGKRVSYSVHVLVAKTFLPNPYNLPEVNHKDLNKANNAASNLEWSTRANNMLHAAEMGAMRSGENHYWSLITKDKAIEIFNAVGTLSDISKCFGVSMTCVGSIKQGKTWAKVTGKKYSRKNNRLSNEDVVDIRKSELSISEIANKYGVTKDHIGRIRRGRLR